MSGNRNKKGCDITTKVDRETAGGIKWTVDRMIRILKGYKRMWSHHK